MKKLTLLFPFVWLFLFAFPQVNPVLAKDYSIKSADFQVQLNLDGSAAVVETRTYNFDGSFSWADEWIDLNAKRKTQNSNLENYEITEFELWEGKQQYFESSLTNPGNYSINQTPEKFYLKWYYSAQNQEKTFTLKYQIKNAITVHQDIAEFYWQLVGDQWSKSTGIVTTSVFLPKPAPDDQIWTFGHGSSNGQIKIATNQRVDFSATSLPVKTFFEVRVLFPKEGLLSSVPKANLTLEKILAEEKSFGEKTKTQARTNWLIVGLLSLIPLGMIIYSLRQLLYWPWQWWRIGKDKPLPMVNLAGKLHEPPSDLDPVLVEALTKWNLKPTGKSIVAIILNLCRKKVLKIIRLPGKSSLGLTQPSPENWLVLLKEKFETVPDLTEREKKLLHFLFYSDKVKTKNQMKESGQTPEGEKFLAFEEIKNYGRNRPSATRIFWEDWQKEAQEELVHGLFFEPTAHRAGELIVKNTIFVWVLVFIGFFATGFVAVIHWLLAVLFFLVSAVSFPAALVLTFLKPNMEKRTEKGNLELASWMAFKRYLKEYSVTKNYPLDSVILWEKYLVYGTALGISLKALSELPIDYSKIATSGLYVYSYGGDGGSISQAASLGYLSSSFASLSTSFSSSGAHGVGSSGGFSGGGGGGGGGGSGGGAG